MPDEPRNAASPPRTIVLDFGEADVRAAAALRAVTDERIAVERDRVEVVRNWERRRRGLLRSLHDRAQQQLLGLRIELLRPADADVARGGGPVGDRLDDAAVLARVRDVSAEIERLAAGLPPSALRIDDMSAALREMAGQSGIRVDVDLPACLATSVVVAELLTYVAGEALANVLRHSAADRCSLSLDTVDGDVVLVVRDPGPALHGVVREVDGHGLAELRRRTGSAGGTLTFEPAGDATVLTLRVPNDPWGDAPTPRDFDDRAPTWSCEARAELRSELSDDDAEIAFRVGADWVDELGRPVVLEPGVAVAVNDCDGHAVGAVRSWCGGERVAAACLRCAPTVVGGLQRAAAAVALRDVWNERNQIARRAAAIEESLARRLTSRPVRILAQACDVIESRGDRVAAATLLLEATDAVREIVTVLSSSSSQVDHPQSDHDPFLFALLGREFGVEVSTVVDQVPSGAARSTIAAVGEHIVVDAPPGSQVQFRLSEGAGRVTLLATMEALPSPRAVAFIEATVLWQTGLFEFELRRDRVLMQLVLPCASS